LSRPAATEAANEDEPAVANEDTKDEPELPAVQSSVPGSVHDSADDESELSEVDEDKLAEHTSAPIFSSLLTKRLSSPKPGSELSTNVSVDGGDGTGDAESAASVSFKDARSELAPASDVEMEG
jgi:hypothetical protein